MPYYPPGLSLDPRNWALAPQPPVLPAYPWSPSLELAQWMPDDNEASAAPAHNDIAQGLLDLMPVNPALTASEPFSSANFQSPTTPSPLPTGPGGADRDGRRAVAQAGLGEDRFNQARINQSQFADRQLGWSEQEINRGQFDDLAMRSGFGIDDPRQGFAYPVQTSDPNVISGRTNSGGFYTNGRAVIDVAGSYRLLRPNPGETLIINPGRGMFGPSIQTTTYKGS